MLKKTIAAVLGAALAILSPGLFCYEALAQSYTSGASGSQGNVGVGGQQGTFRLESFPAPLLTPGLNTPGLTGGTLLPNAALPAPLPLSVIPEAGVTPEAVSAAPITAKTPASSLIESQAAIETALIKGEGVAATVGGKSIHGVANPIASAKAASADSGAGKKSWLTGWLTGLRVFDGAKDRPQGSATQVQDESAVLAPAPESEPSPLKKKADPKGKSLLIVGTPTPVLLIEAKKTADGLGLKLYVADSLENRKKSVGIISDDHFFPASLDLEIPQLAAVMAAEPSYAELAGKIAEQTGALGDSSESGRVAGRNDLTRALFAKVPELSTTFRIGLESAEDARKAFRAMGGERAVLRSASGGGEARTVLSEDEAAAAWAPGMMMEYAWEGPKANVDLVLQTGQDGKTEAVFTGVSDEPGTFPSQLGPELRQKLLESAKLAAEKLGFKSGSLRVSLAMTPEGAKVLGVSKGLPEAAAQKAYKALTGVSLVEQSIRSLFGLAVPQLLAFRGKIEDLSEGWSDPNVEYDAVYKKAVEKRDRILDGYYRGQLARLFAFVQGASLFSPFMQATGGATAMAEGRNAYGWAVALFSPIAGALVERLSVRTILVAAMAARSLIYGVAIPAAVFTLSGPALALALISALLAVFIVDGVVVSMNSLVDMDEGGIDFLARQHHFPVDNEIVKEYNARLGTVSAWLRVAVVPVMAGLGLALTATGLISSAAGALAIVLAVSFVLPGIYGIAQYLRYIPAQADLGNRAQVAGTLPHEMRKMAGEFKDAGALAWKRPQFRWRFLLNAFDRGMMDSMPMVLLTAFGMTVMFPELFAGLKPEQLSSTQLGLKAVNASWGAFATAGLIAVGQLGAVMMLKAFRGNGDQNSWFARLSRRLTPKSVHSWKPPAPGAGQPSYPNYRPFFEVSMMAMLATVLLPLGAMAVALGAFWPGVALAGMGSLLFGMYFIASKIGFMNMMQREVRENGKDKDGRDATGRLFAIQASIELGAAAIIVSVLTYVFNVFPPTQALAIAAALYVAFGLVTRFIAPRLLFTREERR